MKLVKRLQKLRQGVDTHARLSTCIRVACHCTLFPSVDLVA